MTEKFTRRELQSLKVKLSEFAHSYRADIIKLGFAKELTWIENLKVSIDDLIASGKYKKDIEEKYYNLAIEE